MANAVKFAQVMIHRFQAVMSFAGDLIRRFGFGVAFPADEAFVSQATAHIVQSGAARHDLLLLALVGRQDRGDVVFRPIEQLRQVAVTEQGPLRVFWG
jgi:hypothetical protein